jgi:hypothetical protein
MVPPRPSVSLLPSICYPIRRSPSLIEQLHSIISWMRGDKPSLGEQMKEAKLVDKLAAELAAEIEEERRGDDGPTT